MKLFLILICFLLASTVFGDESSLKTSWAVTPESQTEAGIFVQSANPEGFSVSLRKSSGGTSRRSAMDCDGMIYLQNRCHKVSSFLGEHP